MGGPGAGGGRAPGDVARPGLPGAVRSILLLAALAALPARAATLEVVVTGVRNDRGIVLVAVCPEASFLRDTCPYRGRAPARAGEVVVRVEEVPPGVYAVQAYHSEDGSGRLRRSFLGLPRDGIGFSRDAKFNYGPPSFADAAVRLGSEGGRVRLALRYYE
jgi:uncharacterized protein (DUF2141 family)